MTTDSLIIIVIIVIIVIFFVVQRRIESLRSNMRDNHLRRMIGVTNPIKKDSVHGAVTALNSDL